jgi:hypothetical protein
MEPFHSPLTPPLARIWEKASHVLWTLQKIHFKTEKLAFFNKNIYITFIPPYCEAHKSDLHEPSLYHTANIFGRWRCYNISSSLVHPVTKHNTMCEVWGLHSCVRFQVFYNVMYCCELVFHSIQKRMYCLHIKGLRGQRIILLRHLNSSTWRHLVPLKSQQNTSPMTQHAQGPKGPESTAY